MFCCLGENPPASALRVWQKQLLQRSLVISASPNEKGIFSSSFFWISSNIWCDRLTTSYFLKHFIPWSLQYPIFLVFLAPCWMISYTCLLGPPFYRNIERCLSTEFLSRLMASITVWLLMPFHLRFPAQAPSIQVFVLDIAAWMFQSIFNSTCYQWDSGFSCSLPVHPPLCPVLAPFKGP